MNASLNRAQSAFTLGDMGSFQLQDGALGNFTDAVVDGLAKCQHGIEHLVSKLEGTPCDIAIARADVASFIDDVKVRGIAAFPQAELNVFALFNVDPSQAVDAIVNLDPSLVPILLSEGLRQDAAAIGRLAEVYGK